MLLPVLLLYAPPPAGAGAEALEEGDVEDEEEAKGEVEDFVEANQELII